MGEGKYINILSYVGDYLYVVAQVPQTWANMLPYLAVRFREVQVEEHASPLSHFSLGVVSLLQATWLKAVLFLPLQFSDSFSWWKGKCYQDQIVSDLIEFKPLEHEM